MLHDADVDSNDGHGQRAKSEAAAQKPGGHSSHAVRWQIQPYYHMRSLPQKNLKPEPSEVLWSTNAGRAAEMHPVDLMQHQLLPARATPHPAEGAQRRWPENSCASGGLVETGDDRRHAHWFGYREARWKRHWALPQKKEGMQLPSLTIEDIHHFLVEQFGSLQAGFAHLDFFQNGRLSFLELFEGLRSLIRNAPKASKFRSLAEVPVELLTSRLRAIFRSLDIDGDGLIDYDEFAMPFVAPTEPSKALTSRLQHEKQAAMSDLQLQSLSIRRGSTTAPGASDATRPRDEGRAWEAAAAPEDAVDPRHSLRGQTSTAATPGPPGQPILVDFAALLLSKFRNIEEAFRAIDLDGQGRITMSEFSLGAKMLRFTGNPSVVFKCLDEDHRGSIGIKNLILLQKMYDLEEGQRQLPVARSRRESVDARRLRSPIPDKAPHTRGRLISDGDHRPLGEHVASSAGFYSFAREANRRLDPSAHPDEHPASNSACFSPGLGPGYLGKGPEHFGISHTADPVRGNKFKAGATVSKAEKLGPVIPSHSGRLDVERGLWANYQGDRPRDGWHACSSGSTSMKAKDSRLGFTYLTADSSARTAPKPIGPWQQTRVGNRLRATSTPSLMHTVC